MSDVETLFWAILWPVSILAFVTYPKRNPRASRVAHTVIMALWLALSVMCAHNLTIMALAMP